MNKLSIFFIGLCIGISFSLLIMFNMDLSRVKHFSNIEQNNSHKKIRLLCWIMKTPENHQTKAIHFKATWEKRCDTLLFMSSQNDNTLPTIALNVSEGREHLWSKKGMHLNIHSNTTSILAIGS